MSAAPALPSASLLCRHSISVPINPPSQKWPLAGSDQLMGLGVAGRKPRAEFSALLAVALSLAVLQRQLCPSMGMMSEWWMTRSMRAVPTRECVAARV